LSTPHNIKSWAAHVDFSKLRRLASAWGAAYVAILADMTARGELASLEALWLINMSFDGRHSLRRFLGALNESSLQCLHLEGHVDEAMLDVIRDRHGRSLRHLLLPPYAAARPDEIDDDGNMHTMSVDLKIALALRVAQRCPNLERPWLCRNCVGL